MAIRIKSSWHESDRNKPTEKTLEDNAGALAFIAWRLSLESAKKLHREGFEYRSDKERVGVISEFLAFQIQLADRLTFDRLGDEDREAFINALGSGWRTTCRKIWRTSSAREIIVPRSLPC